MSRNKRTVYFTDAALPHLASRTGEDGGLSGVVTTMVDRYAEICRLAKPMFSYQEWRTLFDALKDLRRWVPEQAPLLKEAMRTQLEIAKVDPLLIDQVRNMTYPTVVAVVDEVERFWMAVSRGETPGMSEEG